MKARTTYTKMIITAAAMTLSLASCVKDELYNTSHPDTGIVETTAAWTDVLDGTEPATYRISIDGGTAAEAQSGKPADSGLLTPGRHTVLAYNTPDGFTINGNTATVTVLDDGTIEAMPDHLYSANADVTAVKDDTVRTVLTMKRHTIPVNLKLSIGSGDTSDITGIEATLSGIAGTVDLTNGSVTGTGLVLRPVIVTSVDDIQSGKTSTLQMECIILGTATGEQQLLTVTFTMKDGHQERIVSDLTELLKDINSSKRPVEITGSIEAPQDGSSDGTITEWTATDNFNIEVK